MAKRLKAMNQPRYRNGFELTLQPDVLQVPLAWKKPRLIFVNSMSDLFHDDVPVDFIKRCFDVMVEASHHTFQLLTKRPERVVSLANDLSWPANLWFGVSVENEKYSSRIAELRKVPALTRFLSVEPLLGPINSLKLDQIDWVIVGGESGPDARPMSIEWIRPIRDACLQNKVPFFFKQWGAHGHDGVRRAKEANGRVLDGKVWNQLPKRQDQRR